MRWHNKCLVIIGLALLVVIVSGCAASAPSAEATAAGNAAADRIFQSLNSGNYGDFSANFSAAMLRGANESWFRDFRNAVTAKYGKYVSRSDPRVVSLGVDNNFAYQCKFENATQGLTITMNANDIYTVDGIHFT